MNDMSSIKINLLICRSNDIIMVNLMNQNILTFCI